MSIIKFVRNYNDLSTDSGFQFEFFCDRCGSGHQTEFQGAPIAAVTDMLNAAGSLFGGLFSSAASLGEHARSATWEKAHDDAFRKAIELAKPHFKQCNRCGHWADTVCWNTERGLCKDCTPDLETELSAVQVDATIQQARMKALEANLVSPEKFNQVIVATCGACGSEVKGGKFCPECGTAVKRDTKCTQCGADSPGKFCPECGHKQ